MLINKKRIRIQPYTSPNLSMFALFVYLFFIIILCLYPRTGSCRKLTYLRWFDSKIRSVFIFCNLEDAILFFWCCLVVEVWWLFKIRHEHDEHCNSFLFSGFIMISVTCFVLIPCSSVLGFVGGGGGWLLLFFYYYAGNRYSF